MKWPVVAVCFVVLLASSCSAVEHGARSRLLGRLRADPAPATTTTTTSSSTSAGTTTSASGNTEMPSAKEGSTSSDVPLRPSEQDSSAATKDVASGVASKDTTVKAPSSAPGGAADANAAAVASASAAAELDAVPTAILDWLKPSYGLAVARPLSVDLPEGQSPVDREKFRVVELRRRLKETKERLARLEEVTRKAEEKVDAVYARMEAAGDAMRKAYMKHEVAARGEDLDQVKGDNSTLTELLAAAKTAVEAQDKHFTATTELMGDLPILYDQQLALDNTRMRLERTIATLEAQMANTIAKSAAAGKPLSKDQAPVASL